MCAFKKTTLAAAAVMLSLAAAAYAAVGPGDTVQLVNVQGTVVDTLPDGSQLVRVSAPDEGLIKVDPSHLAGPSPTPPPSLCPSGSTVITTGGSVSTGYTNTPTGGTLCLDGGAYTMANLTVAKAITVLGVGGASVTQTSSSGAMFNVTANNVTIKGLTLVGSGRGTISGSCNQTIGVQTGAVGTVTVDSNTMSQFHCGVLVNGSTQFNVRANKISKTRYTGISMCSGTVGAGPGTVDSNTVTDVHETGGSLGDNAYGIVASCSPVPHDITISNNTVNRVPTWECFDTHSGLRVDFLNNIGIDCGRQPLVCSDVGPDPVCRIEGNRLDLVDKNVAWNAIINQGQNVAGNTVTGNTVTNTNLTGSACIYAPLLDSSRNNGNTCTP